MTFGWTFLDELNETDNAFDFEQAGVSTAEPPSTEPFAFFPFQNTPAIFESFDATSWPPDPQEQIRFDGADLAQWDTPDYFSEQINFNALTVDPPDEQPCAFPPFSYDLQFGLSGEPASKSDSSPRDNQMSIDSDVPVQTTSDANEPVPGPTPEERVSEAAPINVKRRRTSESSGRAGKKRKSVRTLISTAVRLILERHLGRNPYPSKNELGVFAAETNLPAKTVKNWFSNNRSRKRASGRFHIVQVSLHDRYHLPLCSAH